MKIELYNINKIKSASIDIGGLTVIAGNNDTGKSTVGKMLFSIIKAISRQGADLEENIERDVLREIENIYFTLIPRIKGSDFSKSFLPPRFIAELKLIVSFGENQFLTSKDELADLLNTKKEFVNKVLQVESDKKKVIARLDNIFRLCTNSKKDINLAFFKALETTLFSEFQSNICSDSNVGVSRVILSINTEEDIAINIIDDKISTVAIKNEVVKPYEDITFIETPLYLQLSHLIETSRTLLDNDNINSRFNPRVPLHVKDLINKLGLSRYEKEDNSQFVNFIKDVIDGFFDFDKTKNQYLYVKNNSKPILIQNVASGIKIFGIIQLLLQVNEINERRFIVIDEPENHLHPAWQIKFANLIVLLVKSGIPVLLSSHSPYFIHAIKVYSQKEDISSLVNYYLADNDEKSPGMTNIECVNDELNKIFVKLAEPLNDLMSFSND